MTKPMWHYHVYGKGLSEHTEIKHNSKAFQTDMCRHFLESYDVVDSIFG